MYKKEGYKNKKRGKGKKGPGVKKDYVLRMEVEGEMIVLNKDSIKKIVKDIVETRGKQRVKNKENISQLRLILEFFQDKPLFQLETYTLLIPIQFDYFKIRNKNYITREAWNQSYIDIMDFFTLLKNATNLEKFGRLNEAQEREPREFLDEQFYAYVKSLTNQISKAYRWLEKRPAVGQRWNSYLMVYRGTRTGFKTWDCY